MVCIRKSISFTPNLQIRCKTPIWKFHNVLKTFILDTEHDSHSKVPKSRVEHRRAQFLINLRSRSKMTITFSTELGLRRFKRNFKQNSLIYPHTKIHNFWCRDSLMSYISIGFGISQFRVVWTKLWPIYSRLCRIHWNWELK